MNIKEIRKRLDMTQQEFADLVGVCRQSICKWELGEALPSKLAFKIIWHYKGYYWIKVY